MLRIACALSLVAVSSLALAQTPQITRIDVTEFGEYALDVQTTDANSTNGIPQRTVGNVRQLQQTRTIHLHKDMHFGFRYTIVGSPNGADVELRMVVLFPRSGVQRPGTSTPIFRDESARMRTIGLNYYRGYSINDDWLLVPGDWTLELWSGDRRLASETFTLVP